MKNLLIILLAAVMSFTPYSGSIARSAKTIDFAQTKKKTVKVKGYTKKNGTYVKPHYRSKPTKKKK